MVAFAASPYASEARIVRAFPPDLADGRKEMRVPTRVHLAILATASIVGAMLAPPAQAVPSFSRQTGMACAACHTVFPELTHFGRVFKANGYVLDNLQQVRAVSSKRQQLLSLSKTPTLSVMMQTSYSVLSKPKPDAAGGQTQNGTVEFPRQLSLFYAGRIAPHLGIFSQLTYDGKADHVSIDNTDVRFAKLLVLPHKNTLTYGLSLNNNPTVQDLWNTTPAWGYPFSHSNVAVAGTPLGPADVQIDEAFAQLAAGLTAYAFYDESLYVEFGGYRSFQPGAVAPLNSSDSTVLAGFSPYWRVAYEYDWRADSLEVGTYGEDFKVYPGGGAPLSGPTSSYLDVAGDFQFQHVGENNIYTLAGTYVHENMHAMPAGATNPSDTLAVTKLWASYYYRRMYGGQIAWFGTTGTSDGGLYGFSCPVSQSNAWCTTHALSSSATNSPDSNGLILEADYLPWLNVKLSAQYVMFNKFMGAGSNYDGYGRSASDNNVLQVMLWYAF